MRDFEGDNYNKILILQKVWGELVNFGGESPPQKGPAGKPAVMQQCIGTIQSLFSKVGLWETSVFIFRNKPDRAWPLSRHHVIYLS